jgi:predicted ATPase
MAMSRALVSLDDIRDSYPSQFFRYRNNIEKTYYDFLTKKYMKTYRYLQVIYLYGNTGIGKSKYVT